MIFKRPVFVILFLAGIVACSGNTNGSDEVLHSAMAQTLQMREFPLLDSSFSIYIPADYRLTETVGEDFSVFYFSPFDSSSSIEYAGGLYFGNHPNTVENSMDTCRTFEKSGRMLNKNMNWSIRACLGKFHLESIRESNTREGWNKYIHAFGQSSSNDGIDTLIYIFSTIKINKR